MKDKINKGRAICRPRIELLIYPIMLCVVLLILEITTGTTVIHYQVYIVLILTQLFLAGFGNDLHQNGVQKTCFWDNNGFATWEEVEKIELNYKKPPCLSPYHLVIKDKQGMTYLFKYSSKKEMLYYVAEVVEDNLFLASILEDNLPKQQKEPELT